MCSKFLVELRPRRQRLMCRSEAGSSVDTEYRAIVMPLGDAHGFVKCSSSNLPLTKEVVVIPDVCNFTWGERVCGWRYSGFSCIVWRWAEMM